ncbi:MAG: DUF5683 domain-containing protein [Bacteroidota bacterium]|nr:DUF5683 domain-containing protein [Bacteroidota bacterium]
MRHIFLFLFIVTYSYLRAQDTTVIKDSVETLEKRTSALGVLFRGKPGRALAYSLILPGAGQVYNNRIWKVPIVYAGLGTMVYFIYTNKKEYRRFDNIYKCRIDLEDKCEDEFKNRLTTQGIYTYRNYYDRNLQLSYIGLAAVYLLNGIEAFVDRHLQEFDISEDLSLHFGPSNHESGVQFGLSLKLK